MTTQCYFIHRLKVGMSLFIISTFNFETERAKFFSDKVVGQINSFLVCLIKTKQQNIR